jgi:hypothetical protein
MTLSRSTIVPLAFWFGFLALGFVSSVGGPAKPHPVNEAQVLENPGKGGGASETIAD